MTYLRCSLGLAFVTASACAGHPEPDDLYGMWANVEEGDVRVLEFAASGEDDLSGVSDVFYLDFYAEGTAPTQVQRGTFEILEGDGWELVTTVTAAQDSSQVGQSYGNPILDFGGGTLTLETGDGGERVYEETASKP